jgi:hypothetical protein
MSSFANHAFAADQDLAHRFIRAAEDPRVEQCFTSVSHEPRMIQIEQHQIRA